MTDRHLTPEEADLVRMATEATSLGHLIEKLESMDPQERAAKSRVLAKGRRAIKAALTDTSGFLDARLMPLTAALGSTPAHTAATFDFSTVTSLEDDDVIDEALDIAMVDPGQVTISKLEDVSLNADFKLLAIAAKNMIDNALKYSPNKHVNITITRESIKFINKGERLSKELRHYVEPFTKGESAQKSFGLGLYIVENIIKAHKLTLSYEYKNGLNVFSFENLQNIAA